MSNEQIVFEPEELLESHPIAEPLICAGVRCHGGFDADGEYVSPRTKQRGPAIRAWQAQHVRTFGAEILDVGLDRWPVHYPNVAQSRFLLRRGITRPMVATLTRIGTVEGFGANIGVAAIPDLAPYFAEDVRGTAMAHLTKGLYEAHGRDEAGFGDEGGHRQMWYAARDVAFEKPLAEEDFRDILRMMGVPGYGDAPPNGASAAAFAQRMREQMIARRVLPDDIDFALEAQIARMIRLLFIELGAYRAFAWAEELLSDGDLVAGDGAAGRIVSYIRADEAPHVAYLRTVLTEMRDRTFVGTSGRHYAGQELITRLWDRALVQSMGQSRLENRAMQLRSVEAALEGHPRAASTLEEFHALGHVRPGPDGSFREVEAPAQSSDAAVPAGAG